MSFRTSQNDKIQGRPLRQALESFLKDLLTDCQDDIKEGQEDLMTHIVNELNRILRDMQARKFLVIVDALAPLVRASGDEA